MYNLTSTSNKNRHIRTRSVTFARKTDCVIKKVTLKLNQNARDEIETKKKTFGTRSKHY